MKQEIEIRNVNIVTSYPRRDGTKLLATFDAVIRGISLNGCVLLCLPTGFIKIVPPEARSRSDRSVPMSFTDVALRQRFEEKAFLLYETMTGECPGKLEVIDQDRLPPVNFNHFHAASGGVISTSSDGYLTVGDMRDAIAPYGDDHQIMFGVCNCGEPVVFGGFKSRGPDVLGINIS